MRQFYLIQMFPTMVGDKRRYVLAYSKGEIIWRSKENALGHKGAVVIFGSKELAEQEKKHLEKATDPRLYWLSIRAESHVWWAV